MSVVGRHVQGWPVHWVMFLVLCPVEFSLRLVERLTGWRR
jgi:hypothetical protein